MRESKQKIPLLNDSIKSSEEQTSNASENDLQNPANFESLIDINKEYIKHMTNDGDETSKCAEDFEIDELNHQLQNEINVLLEN